MQLFSFRFYSTVSLILFNFFFFDVWELTLRYYQTSIVNGILTVSSTQILILSLYNIGTSYVWTYGCELCYYVAPNIRISFRLSSISYHRFKLVVAGVTQVSSVCLGGKSRWLESFEKWIISRNERSSPNSFNYPRVEILVE